MPPSSSVTCPGGELIRAVAKRLLPLVRELFPNQIPESVEWWAHRRVGAGAGHQLHWDLDEKGLLAGEGIRHPVCSCVVYIR